MFGLFGSRESTQQPSAGAHAVPPLDLQVPATLETATFANG